MKLFGNGVMKKEEKRLRILRRQKKTAGGEYRNGLQKKNRTQKTSGGGIRPWVALLTLVAGFFVGAFHRKSALGQAFHKSV